MVNLLKRRTSGYNADRVAVALVCSISSELVADSRSRSWGESFIPSRYFRTRYRRGWMDGWMTSTGRGYGPETEGIFSCSAFLRLSASSVIRTTDGSILFGWPRIGGWVKEMCELYQAVAT